MIFRHYIYLYQKKDFFLARVYLLLSSPLLSFPALSCFLISYRCPPLPPLADREEVILHRGGTDGAHPLICKAFFFLIFSSLAFCYPLASFFNKVGRILMLMRLIAFFLYYILNKRASARGKYNKK